MLWDIFGAYGLPQFQMRVFVWGAWPNKVRPVMCNLCNIVLLVGYEYKRNSLTYAHSCSSQRLPQYPPPTHNVVVRGVTPVEFEV